MKDFKDILSKYGKKIDKELESPQNYNSSDFSREYKIFRKEALGNAVTFYEKLCLKYGNIIKVKLKPIQEEKIKESIELAHLEITPEMPGNLAALNALVFLVTGVLIGILNILLNELSLGSVFLPLMIIMVGFILIKPLTNMPNFIAAKWRLKASDQMVVCILYIAMFMRHTSNLEHAIKFAGTHIGNPLALDLRKIFWDVEIGKYANIKKSLDAYLIKWRNHNSPFVESINLIQSSLYEPSEEKRIERLEKSLKVILEGTYDKMLHFAHDVRNPIMMLYMMGVLLPILGLIILPLMGSLLGIKWWQIGILYNIIIPVVIYFMGQKILMKRPTGYTGTNIFEEERYKQLEKVKIFGRTIEPHLPAVLLGIFIVLLGLIPLIMHLADPGLKMPLEPYGLEIFGDDFLDYRTDDEGNTYGPFGIGAAILGFLITAGVGFSIGLYYKLKTKKLIKMKNETAELDKEFASTLFQLGNRIGDGLPSEIAFSKVAENTTGTRSGEFFRITDKNIRQRGMDLEGSIFDEEVGSIKTFPSNLIETSMKVLIESAKKGSAVVSKCLISISVYIEKIKAVNQRMKDLLAEITSSMKGQISFLTPVIAGVVVGLGSLMSVLIGKVTSSLGEGLGSGGESSLGIDTQNLISLFPMEKMMAPYFFQIVVGLFVVEIIILLSILSVSIEKGFDKTVKENTIGKNLYRGVTIYLIISFIVMIIFSALSGRLAIGIT